MPYRADFDPALAPTPEVLAEAKTGLALGLRHHWIKEWNVKTGLTDEQFLAIKRTLSQSWAVCAGCRWHKRPEWSDDVLQMCPAEAVFDGHSVLLVGYRDDTCQAGGGSFIFRNTSNGGRDGAMPYTYARTYINACLSGCLPSPVFWGRPGIHWRPLLGCFGQQPARPGSAKGGMLRPR